jgi:hypothetical protein
MTRWTGKWKRFSCATLTIGLLCTTGWNKTVHYVRSRTCEIDTLATRHGQGRREAKSSAALVIAKFVWSSKYWSKAHTRRVYNKFSRATSWRTAPATLHGTGRGSLKSTYTRENLIYGNKCFTMNKTNWLSLTKNDTTTHSHRRRNSVQCNAKQQ